MMKLPTFFTSFPIFLSSFGFLFFAPANSDAEIPSDSDRIVVMISVDGLAGFYLEDPKAELPNLRALAADGARASGMKVSTPSVTWPNHTTLVTGVPPAVHGLVSNNDFDRKNRKKRNLIGGVSFDKDEIVHVPTLYDVASENGMSTAAIRWPASRNAQTLDWTVPATKAGAEKEYTTPSLLEDAEKAGVVFHDKHKDDVWCTTLFNYILRTHRPNLAFLHIIDVDGVQHRNGPRSPEAYETIKAADERIGEVWEILKNEFADRATLIVVSDHGFAPVDKLIRPNIVLKKAGLLAEKAADSDIQIVSQGGAAMVYVLDDEKRAELLEKITEVLQDVEGIASLLPSSDFEEYGVATPEQNPHSPDLFLFAEEGYAFRATSSGNDPVVKQAKRTGAHGHDANLPNLQGVFVAWGAGIRSGAKLGTIDNTRVAPTAATLLDLSLPAPAAAPLTDILTAEE